MRTLIRALILALFFFIGSSWQAKHIQATCESDDQPTFIAGTQYLCLSQRHVRMLQRQQSMGVHT
ncbi:hypothetical protein R6138_04357 [Ralstonia thomasii]|uniref:hypothetical protein n=1 Tax=Ralstonia thomasii TaxID=3058596 RepID=UPI0028F5AFE4|nr:hypothetical protein [Ralstonia sp. LMG 18095]CAJ0899647.1 hypothetical protein R6138_04357 [Ralstonia sp. LMG 18095]